MSDKYRMSSKQLLGIGNLMGAVIAELGIGLYHYVSLPPAPEPPAPRVYWIRDVEFGNKTTNLCCIEIDGRKFYSDSPCFTSQWVDSEFRHVPDISPFSISGNDLEGIFEEDLRAIKANAIKAAEQRLSDK